VRGNPADPTLPQSLKSVRIIAFAFYDAGVTESPNRGTKTFDRFVPNAEGFGQSMFQDFALGIERLSGPVAES
jgi:hypothetical protein